jgi:fumarylacetoacetase
VTGTPATALAVPAGSPFGVDNLPYGVFSTAGTPPRVGVRVGDAVVDLAAALGTDGPDAAFAAPALNPFMAQGRARWIEIRERITALVTGDVPDAAVHAVDTVVLHLPFEVADYVDFYASEHHATNLGRLFRPDAEPLTPNWKHMPLGYHGRAGTLVVSGTDVIRPSGQRRDTAEAAPTFGPSTRLDLEAEVGFVVGVGTPLGAPIPVDAFAEHVFGAVLVNDWSARDLQAWEYVPLGPHLGKSFATSVSPWVVPLLALEAARIPLPGQGDPRPLPYLRASAPWGLDIDLAVEWNGEVVSRPPYREMYWSPAQMLAHMTVNGASTRTGDLFASGTVSGPARDQQGSLIELTRGGREPITLNGEPRTFLRDGDTVVLTGTAPGAAGGRIGFGEARGRIRMAAN